MHWHWERPMGVDERNDFKKTGLLAEGRCWVAMKPYGSDTGCWGRGIRRFPARSRSRRFQLPSGGSRTSTRDEGILK